MYIQNYFMTKTSILQMGFCFYVKYYLMFSKHCTCIYLSHEVNSVFLIPSPLVPMSQTNSLFLFQYSIVRTATVIPAKIYLHNQSLDFQKYIQENLQYCVTIQSGIRKCEGELGSQESWLIKQIRKNGNKIFGYVEIMEEKSLVTRTKYDVRGVRLTERPQMEWIGSGKCIRYKVFLVYGCE